MNICIWDYDSGYTMMMSNRVDAHYTLIYRGNAITTYIPQDVKCVDGYIYALDVNMLVEQISSILDYNGFEKTDYHMHANINPPLALTKWFSTKHFTPRHVKLIMYYSCVAIMISIVSLWLSIIALLT